MTVYRNKNTGVKIEVLAGTKMPDTFEPVNKQKTDKNETERPEQAKIGRKHRATTKRARRGRIKAKKPVKDKSLVISGDSIQKISVTEQIESKNEQRDDSEKITKGIILAPERGDDD